MKAFYFLPIIGIVLLQSCNSYTYVSQMPNEPMLEKAWQVQHNVAAGPNHAEMQTSVSVCRFGGLTYNYFIGQQGTRSKEYGLVLFTPIKKNLYTSLSFGKKEGKIDFGTSNNYLVDYVSNRQQVDFRGYYIQPCIYANVKDGQQLGFSLKLNSDFYEKYDYTSTVTYGTQNKRITQHYTAAGVTYRQATFLATYRATLDYWRFGEPYLLIQFGYARPLNRILMQNEKTDGQYGTPQVYSVSATPIFQSFALNVAIGIKFSDFKALFK